MTTKENLIKLSNREKTLKDEQRHLSVVNSSAAESGSSKVINKLMRDISKVSGRTIMSQPEMIKVCKVDKSMFMSQPKSDVNSAFSRIDGVTTMSQSKLKESERQENFTTMSQSKSEKGEKKENRKKVENTTPKSNKKTTKRLVISRKKIPMKEQCELQRMFEKMKQKKVDIEPILKERNVKEYIQKENLCTPKKEVNAYIKEKESLEKKRKVRSIKEAFENIKKKEEKNTQCDFIRSESSRSVGVNSVLPKSGLNSLNSLMVYENKKENVLLNSSQGKRKFSEVEPQTKLLAENNFNLHFTPKKRREF